MCICLRKGQCFVILAIFLLLSLAMFASIFQLSRQALAVVPYFCRQAETTFVIDPGHGGEDGGAVSKNGLQEDDLNLAISKRLDALFGFYGVKSLMTRDEDISLHTDPAHSLRSKKTADLKNRVALVNGIEQATLISIHQNSFPQRSSSGAQVFYRNDDASRALAQEIQSRVHSFLDPANQRQAQRVADNVYLMNRVQCRAVLVECGFLSNPTDETKLQKDCYQQKIAAVIAAACLQGE